MALSAFGALLQGLAMGYQQAKAWQEQEKQRKIQELLASLQQQRFEEVEKPESAARVALTNVQTATGQHELQTIKDIANWWNQQGYGPMGVGVGLKRDLADIGATEAATKRTLTLLPHEAAIMGAEAANAPRYFAAQARAAEIPGERWDIEKAYLPDQLRLSNLLLGGQVTAQDWANYLNKTYGERERQLGIEATEADIAATKGAEERARTEFEAVRPYLPGYAAQKFRLGELEIDAQDIANALNRIRLGIANEFDYKMAAVAYEKAQEELNQARTQGEFLRPLLELDLATGKERLTEQQIRNKYLEPGLQLDLATGQFNLQHAQELAPYEVRQAAAEASQAESRAEWLPKSLELDYLTGKQAYEQQGEIFPFQKRAAEAGARKAEAEAEVAEATKEYQKRVAAAEARLAEGKADEMDLLLAFMPEDLALDLQAKAIANDISLDELAVREATRDARIQQAKLNVQALQADIAAIKAKAATGQPVEWVELLNFGGKCWDAMYGNPVTQLSMVRDGEPIPDRARFAAEVANRMIGVLQGRTPKEWEEPEPSPAVVTKEAQAAAKWILERPEVKGNPVAARSYWMGMSPETRREIADAWGTEPAAIDLALSGQNEKTTGVIGRIVNWFKSVFKR